MLFLSTLFYFCSLEAAETFDQIDKPPQWMMDGLIAASQDPTAKLGVADIPDIDWLISSLARDYEPEKLRPVVIALAEILDLRSTFYAPARVKALGTLKHIPADSWNRALVDRILVEISAENSGGTEGRLAAIEAILDMPIQLWDEATFTSLSTALTGDDKIRGAALKAISKAPRRIWSDEILKELEGRILKSFRCSSTCSNAALLLTIAPTEKFTTSTVVTLKDSLDSLEEIRNSRSTSVEAALISAIANSPDTYWAEYGLVEIISKRLKAGPELRAASAMALGQAPESSWSDQLMRKLIELLDANIERDPKVGAAASYALSAAPENAWGVWAIEQLVQGSADLSTFKAIDSAPDAAWSEELVTLLLSSNSESNRTARDNISEAERALLNAQNTMGSVARAEAIAKALDAFPKVEQNTINPASAVATFGFVPNSFWDQTVANSLIAAATSTRSDNIWEDLYDTRIAAVFALTKAPSRVWSEDLVLKLLGNTDPFETPYNLTVYGAIADAPDIAWSAEIVQLLLERVQQETRGARLLDVMSVTRTRSQSSYSLLYKENLLKEWPSATRRVRVIGRKSTALQVLTHAPEQLWSYSIVEALIETMGSTKMPISDRELAFRLIEKIPNGQWSEELVDKIFELIDPMKEANIEVRRAAVQAISHVPDSFWSAELVDVLLASLDKEHEKSQSVRSTVALVLGGIPDGHASEKLLLAYVRAAVSGDVLSPIMLVQGNAANAGNLVPVLNRVLNAGSNEAPKWRAIARFLSGASNEASIPVAWLGVRGEIPLHKLNDDHQKAYETLRALHSLRPLINDGSSLWYGVHKTLAEISIAACKLPGETTNLAKQLSSWLDWLSALPTEGPVQRCWSEEQAAELSQIADWVEESNVAGAQAMKVQLSRDGAAEFSKIVTWVTIGWILFWGGFIFLFPHSRVIQAAFIFNPIVRRYLSLGTVPLFLFLIPQLRRRLLAPFRDDFLADAKLIDFEGIGYFEHARGRHRNEAARPVSDLLAQHRGAVVLRAEAGLGKTTTLRKVARDSDRPIVFLHARDCGKGVPEAIVRKMKNIQDTNFVEKMVHAGALEVIVDGLNEVSADTRELVRSFAAGNQKARLVIGTQPIEWHVPEGATVIDLEKYSKVEAEDFLLSRPIGKDSKQRVYGEQFRLAAKRFLNSLIFEASNSGDEDAALLVLSNPFDLTLAADLIAQGADLTSDGLIEEAFRLADEGPGNDSYRAVHNRPFPIKEFGLHAVKMRDIDRNWLEPGEFEAERPYLLRRKLLVRRAVRSSREAFEDRELFRHDKVWDFFIVEAFRTNDALLDKYFGDPRFRGAFLRIAETWPPEDAKIVRDQLVEEAAVSNDNNTSNEFVRRLRSRTILTQTAASNAASI